MTETLDRTAGNGQSEAGQQHDSSAAAKRVSGFESGSGGHGARPAARRAAIGFAALAIVAVGVIGAVVLVKTKPRTARTPAATPARVLVQAETVRSRDVIAVVHAMGTVVAAREIELRPLAAGEVVGLHPEFVPGGFLNAGEEILRIDPRDHELAHLRQKAQLEQAEALLILEQGRRDVAEREWELVQGDGDRGGPDRSLALREPQMRSVQAAVNAARAAVDEAILSIERTRVRAPFNCVVSARYVDLGSQASPQIPVARLVGTDEFWVRVSLPVDRLDWICFPDGQGAAGSVARVSYGPADAMSQREGRVFRLLSDLESSGRMAQVLVTVPDPLDLGGRGDGRAHPLLLGDFVRVRIDGRLLESVVRVPRTALRDNGTVWVASPDDTLDVRNVRVAWREPDTVLVSEGLVDGDRVIVSSLGTPVPGLPVRVGNDDDGDAPDRDPAALGDDAA